MAKLFLGADYSEEMLEEWDSGISGTLMKKVIFSGDTVRLKHQES